MLVQRHLHSADIILSGIVTCSISAGGSGLTNGTYNNVKLFNNGGTTWDGATATVVVSGNQVTQADITAGGSGYAGGETLDLDNTFTGGSGAEVTTSTVGISTVLGNTVQITGLTTATGGYYRISGVPASKSDIYGNYCLLMIYRQVNTY